MSTAKSAERVSTATNGNSASKTNGHVQPGVSVRMGPMEDDMDIDKPSNGTKRKSSMTNGKTYKEASVSDDDDDAPLVRDIRSHHLYLHLSDVIPEQA